MEWLLDEAVAHARSSRPTNMQSWSIEGPGGLRKQTKGHALTPARSAPPVQPHIDPTPVGGE